jgi:endonuclease/exonuclease/phosphatase (EEP) superfamily protein YafD
MFPIPEKILYSQTCAASSAMLPNPFGLLCWNLNKTPDAKRLASEMERWSSQWDFHLCLFQEARLDTMERLLHQRYEIRAGINLELRGKRYGVLSASTACPLEADGGHSLGREALFGPPKAYLLTRYSLSENHNLLCLNLHAINFRETRRYRRELKRLQTLLNRHRGPMIVAGDFNRWNRGREEALNRFAEQLGLTQVPLEDKPVKAFMGHPLDFIFYRDLSLRHCDVLRQSLSDHNPIAAEFSPIAKEGAIHSSAGWGDTA